MQSLPLLLYSLVSFCMARYRGKQEKTLELLIYFAERFKISTKCVLQYSCHSVVIWHCGMNLIKNTSRVELDARLVKCCLSSKNRFSTLFILNLFKNLNLCSSYIKQIMNVSH